MKKFIFHKQNTFGITSGNFTLQITDVASWYDKSIFIMTMSLLIQTTEYPILISEYLNWGIHCSSTNPHRLKMPM